MLNIVATAITPFLHPWHSKDNLFTVCGASFLQELRQELRKARDEPSQARLRTKLSRVEQQIKLEEQRRAEKAVQRERKAKERWARESPRQCPICVTGRCRCAEQPAVVSQKSACVKRCQDLAADNLRHQQCCWSTD